MMMACCVKAQQQGPLYLQKLDKSGKSPIEQFLNRKAWNSLFPHRYGIGIKDSIHHNPDFYSFNALVQASRYFPSFLQEEDQASQKRELAAFLAMTASETSGGWATAPGGYFKWGYYYLSETSAFAYADTSKINYLPVSGVSYAGRGPSQLSWNYNYGQFSEAWYGNKDSLLDHPDLLASDPVLSFASAIWFWVTPQYPKPSCHDIMAGKWMPSAIDSAGNRFPGFGSVVNVVNGGVECGQGTDLEKTSWRYQYYLFFCNYFHVSPGENIKCTNQRPFGK